MPFLFRLYCVAVFTTAVYCSPAESARDHVDVRSNRATVLADVESKVNELLGRMNLEEKLGQLSQLDGHANGTSRPEYHEMARKGLLGSTLNIRGAEHVNPLQQAAMESRLKIPLLFAFDVIHGYRTLFPIPLGETATWDLEAVELAAAIAAEESRSVGLHWTFAPMVDVARDPRWGRVMEGSGEDVYLGSKMAEARVRGFQGSDYSDPKRIMACAKHFVGYGAVEGGKDYNTVDMSERRLRETYLPPFKACVDMGVGSFMTAFNDLNGVPATGNKFILRNILRGEWKFDGLVVSDYKAVAELIPHGLAANRSEAAMYGLNGGCDMEMMERTYNEHGEALVNAQKVAMETINTAVRNVLRAKFRLKLWDNLYVNETLEASTLMKAEFQQAAREITAKSFVLLRNEPFNGTKVLPLSKEAPSTILILGALADNKTHTLDWWPGDARADDSITIRQGIQDYAQGYPGITTRFVKGCNELCDSKTEFSEAIAAANQATVVVLVVGETREISGEAGSRASIDLPGFQLDLVKEIAALGKPYVVLLKNGRPLTIDWLAANAPAILVTWHSGTMGGAAVADVLFGDVNPSGKLPMTFPRSVGQIPIHYDYKNTGRPYVTDADRFTARYTDMSNTPQYPFGFGLSYTTFEYKNLTLDKENVPHQGTLTVAVTLRNTGSRNGTEVVQLYIRDIAASITRPVRQLRGFQRVELESGQEKQVEFILGPQDLGFLDEKWNMIVESGEFEVFVGGDSYASLSRKFNVLPGPPPQVVTTPKPSSSASTLFLTSVLTVFPLMHALW